jgi:excisionase family DNA binding protein
MSDMQFSSREPTRVGSSNRKTKRRKKTKAERAALRAARKARLVGAAYLPPEEFAALAGISLATVWRMMKDNKLRFARFGRARRIPVTELERLTTTA